MMLLLYVHLHICIVRLHALSTMQTLSVCVTENKEKLNKVKNNAKYCAEVFSYVLILYILLGYKSSYLLKYAQKYSK